jgi:hypothetical protein
MQNFVPFSVLLALPVFGAPAAARLDYGRDVRPILSENCFHCHGQDSKKRMAGLRLDSFEGATAVRPKGRAALTPGNPDASGLYQRIASANPNLRMPPAHSNRTLTPAQVATLKRWIGEGGKYAQHWAFVPPTRPPLPETVHRARVKQPIDAFVFKRLEAEGLAPRPAAAPAAWLRRVSLDLTGLPPSPSEQDGFAKDAAARGDAAYEAAAERLLGSSRYGERMAMDWLDVSRYADTHGFNNDAERSMWRWRDWVIASFNANLPYDRFLTEQLAGDLLPNPTLDQRIATGFGRNHVINSEGGIIDEEYRVEYVSDRVRTLGMSWLGLTLECARCHDHKYDPITQRDHYRFFAFFNNVPEIGEDGRVANAVPMIPAPTAPQQRKLAELEAAITRLADAVYSREANWTWRETGAAWATGPVPDGAALQLHCETPAEFEKPPEGQGWSRAGIAGPACQPSQVTPKPETAQKAPISKRLPFTFSLWVQPAASDGDVALLSAIDYARNPASTTFGSGIEFRLTGGELELRFSQRYPAYSMRIRSTGAGLAAGEWSHLTLVYQGAEPDSLRAYASWVRIFASGREVPVRVLNDGLGLPEAKTDKPSPTRFRIGWDNAPNSARLAGLLDEALLWPRALSEDEIGGLFRGRALPYALARLRAQQASPGETGWVRSAMLNASETGPLGSLRREWLALKRSIPTVMVMQEMATPRQTFLLMRGAYNAPGEKVEPGVPEQLLGSWPEGAPKNRLGLAQWLTKPDHPLTARVVVNRFWQQVFGQGLVKTSENFGVQGDSPAHPEVLDWLAREFIDSGWNVKALMKRLVLSATYRQDSAAPSDLIARDPENRLLARGPRYRLPAESIRDQALAVSGLLQERLGGPSVYPYQPDQLYKGLVVAADYPGTKYVVSQGDDLYRRSLYTFWKRTVPHPTMTVFDAPDREFCIVRRSSTNTPMQALTLLNDPIFVEAARKLAERAVREGAPPPDAGDRRILLNTFDDMLAAYRTDEKGALGLLSIGASPRDTSIPVSELAAYTAVANMILNLDEVITKG